MNTYGEVLGKFLADFSLPEKGAEKQVSVLASVLVSMASKECNRGNPLFVENDSVEKAVISGLGYSENLFLRYQMMKLRPLNEKRFLQKVQKWVVMNTGLSKSNLT